MRAASLIISLFMGALPLSADNKFGTCEPVEVGVYRERVHIRCSNQLDGFTFFAVPTSDPDYANRVVTVGTAAISFNKRLLVLYDPSDSTSGPRFGCLVNDCRPALGVFLLK
jgi:hypothetical protein